VLAIDRLRAPAKVALLPSARCNLAGGPTIALTARASRHRAEADPYFTSPGRRFVASYLGENDPKNPSRRLCKR